MAEIRRGLGGDAAGGERLPWFEPVEEEDDYPEGGLNGGLMLFGIGALVALALVVAGVVLVRHWQASRADIGQIIRAPAGPYKVKPANPGGLRVDGAGPVAQQTGTGGDIDSPLDLAAIPEQPVTGAGSGQPAPVPAPPAATVVRPAPTAAVPGRPAAAPAAPVATVPAAPKLAAAPPPAAKPTPVPRPAAAPVAEVPPAPAGGGSTIQLGAFSSEAKAKSAWKSLSSRFGFLGAMTMAVSPVKSGDATLYRLRASGGGSAAKLCAQLKVAGESCAVAG